MYFLGKRGIDDYDTRHVEVRRLVVTAARLAGVVWGLITLNFFINDPDEKCSGSVAETAPPEGEAQVGYESRVECGTLLPSAVEDADQCVQPAMPPPVRRSSVGSSMAPPPRYDEEACPPLYLGGNALSSATQEAVSPRSDRRS